MRVLLLGGGSAGSVGILWKSSDVLRCPQHVFIFLKICMYVQRFPHHFHTFTCNVHVCSTYFHRISKDSIIFPQNCHRSRAGPQSKTRAAEPHYRSAPLRPAAAAGTVGPHQAIGGRQEEGVVARGPRRGALAGGGPKVRRGRI